MLWLSKAYDGNISDVALLRAELLLQLCILCLQALVLIINVNILFIQTFVAILDLPTNAFCSEHLLLVGLGGATGLLQLRVEPLNLEVALL